MRGERAALLHGWRLEAKAKTEMRTGHRRCIQMLRGVLRQLIGTSLRAVVGGWRRNRVEALVLRNAKLHIKVLSLGGLYHLCELTSVLTARVGTPGAAVHAWKRQIRAVARALEQQKRVALDTMRSALETLGRQGLVQRISLWRRRKDCTMTELENEILRDELWLGLKGASLRSMALIVNRILARRAMLLVTTWRMRAEDNRIVSRTMDYMRNTKAVGQHEGLRQMLHLVRDYRYR